MEQGRDGEMKSKRAYVLSTRAAHDIIQQMIHRWTLDTIASVGARKGVGSVAYGYAVVNRGGTRVQEPEEFSDSNEWAVPSGDEMDPPQVTLKSESKMDVEVSESDVLGRSHIITLHDACESAEETARNLYYQFLLNADKGKTTYRKFAVVARARFRMTTFLIICKEHLAESTYSKKRKRKGIQCISTRHTTIPPCSIGYHGGKPAWRQGRGRPALPVSAWMNAYEARNRKRRKTGLGKGKTRKPYTFKNRRKVTKPPPTYYPRPKHRRNLKCTSDGRRGPEVFVEVESSVDIAEFFEQREIDETLLAAELSLPSPFDIEGAA
jgi:hypothetical protein